MGEIKREMRGEMMAELINDLREDLKNVDIAVRDNISDVKRTTVDVEELKAGDSGQKALIKVKNTKVTMNGEGTVIKKCESIESSTEDDMIHLDQENDKL